MSPAAGSSRGPAYEHTAELRLESHGQAVRAARAFVARQLHRWGVSSDLADTALLLVSEVVTNAVRHAPPPTLLSLQLGDAGLRVAVTDLSPAAPHVGVAGPDDEGGRGLWLLQNLSSTWGHAPSGGGKVVWFEL